MQRPTSPAAFWSHEAPKLGFQLIDRNLDEGRDWERALYTGRALVETTIEKTGMRVGPDTSVLEIGCGIGRLAFALADRAKEVVGVDVSPWYIEQARQYNSYENVRFEVIDGNGLDDLRGGGTYDIVFSHGVFVYMDLELVAKYARDAIALLRPGGQLVFELESMPRTRLSRAARLVRRGLHLAGVRTWRGWPTDPRFHRRVHDFETLVRALLSAGYYVEHVAEAPGHTWFVAKKPAAQEALRSEPPAVAGDEPERAAAGAP